MTTLDRTRWTLPKDRWLEAELRNRRQLWSELVGSGVPTRGWKQALLDFASETPDNLACVERLEVGELPPRPGHRRGLGLRFKNGGGSLTDAAHALEDSVDPEELRARCPEVAVEDWDAFLRLVTLLMNALERPGEENRCP